jgi:hypothetical protein
MGVDLAPSGLAQVRVRAGRVAIAGRTRLRLARSAAFRCAAATRAQ